MSGENWVPSSDHAEPVRQTGAPWSAPSHNYLLGALVAWGFLEATVIILHVNNLV